MSKWDELYEFFEGKTREELIRFSVKASIIIAQLRGEEEEMSEHFRTPWLSDVVDILKRDSIKQITVGNKEFVLVVRCKDCKYRQGSVCDYSAVWVRPNGYCQWGERRDDERPNQ